MTVTDLACCKISSQLSSARADAAVPVSETKILSALNSCSLRGMTMQGLPLLVTAASNVPVIEPVGGTETSTKSQYLEYFSTSSERMPTICLKAALFGT